MELRFTMKNKSKLLIKISIILSGIIIAVLTAIAIGSANQPNTAVSDEMGKYSLLAENQSDEIDFLSQFGLSAVAESRSCEKITIPAEFNSIYEQYNELQKQIGLNLENYRGETVEKVTYLLDNGEYAVLLVIKNRVIGGHITNGEYGSENRPLI